MWKQLPLEIRCYDNVNIFKFIELRNSLVTFNLFIIIIIIIYFYY